MSLGGSKTQTATSSSGIDPEFKPYLKRVISDVTDRYEAESADPSQVVAGTQALEPGLRAQEQVAAQGLAGIDPAAIQRQLANTQGALSHGAQGNLGSARQQRANAAALADQAVSLQQADLQQRALAAQGLTGVGQARRGLEQERLDAPHTAAQRYFGYLGNVGQQNTQTTPKQGK